MPKNEQYSDEEEVAAVTVHLDIDHHHDIGSKLLTNFYRSIPKFKLNSNIIINNNIEISSTIISHTNSSKSINPPQLLYRGTRDGFNSKDFHSKCDNQGPTLTIIKSAADHAQIFGGFTTQNWKSSNSEYISDDFSFIFKIDENSNSNQLFRKFNVKQDKKRYAIYSSPYCLPSFGGGCDICICSDCNLYNYSYSNFGFSYELPPPPSPSSNNDGEYYQYRSEKAKRYLAGSSKFIVSEIEVFKIITTTAIQ